MQQFGMGVEGLGQVLGFLGIAACIGYKKKLKEIQDLVGTTQAKVCKLVLEENIAEEIHLSKDEAKKTMKFGRIALKGLLLMIKQRQQRRMSCFEYMGTSVASQLAWMVLVKREEVAVPTTLSLVTISCLEHAPN
jgi:hypothetical protein